jgi:hypothetical protein
MRQFILLTLAFLLLSNISAYVREYNEENFLDSSSESSEEEDLPRVDEKELGYRYLNVCLNDETGKLFTSSQEGDCPKRVAIGKYWNGVNQTGWGVLEIETFGPYEPALQAYAAGVAEGVLTKLQIYYHFRNTVEGLCTNQTAYCEKLYRYLTKNLDWIKATVKTKPADDIYWRQVNMSFAQLTGMWHGYNNKRSFTPETAFALTPIYMIQLSGELIDLSKALNRTFDAAVDDPEPEKCSGFVKVTEGNKDLMFSHVSMAGYNTMNRILKLYKFGYDHEHVPGHTLSFSGYAGALASGDDFVISSAGLTSTETTFAIFHEELYSDKYVKPDGQLHCWIRSIISSQLSKTASEWVKTFSRYNSGTYNNQWTVVDYKLFKPGQELPNTDLVWILEQVPGKTASRDMTWFIRKYGYWPSYNIPYLDTISKLSGFDQKGVENNWWRWGFSPRARIFHRDQNKVKDLDSLRKLMRYNDYTNEPFSRCNCSPPYSAESSIATRGDLNPVNGTYEVPGMGHRNHGSLDFKGTNYELVKQLRLQAQGGPTFDPLPPFSWKTTDIVAPHYGQPTLWKFGPLITEWETPVKSDLE